MVGINRLLRSIEINTFHWKLTLVSANQASSNSGQFEILGGKISFSQQTVYAISATSFVQSSFSPTSITLTELVDIDGIFFETAGVNYAHQTRLTA